MSDIHNDNEQLTHLRSLLSDEEVIYPSTTCSSPSSDLYLSETSTWAAQKNQQPRLVLRPSSADSLSRVLAYISTTDLDMAIRSSGYGSASARDVLISMAAFDEFDFDRDSEVLTLGAGLLWRNYYEKMEQVAPEYHVVAARTPALGIGGSILSGGFSWLARQYGNTSDPENMLDAQVVKMDGSVLWASEEPELLWALRGAGASFAAVTKFKLKAYRYPQSIFAGPIIIPRRHLSDVAKGIAKMNAHPPPPQVSMDLYVLRQQQAAHMGASEDLLILQAFDALGEDHGRSEGGFKWALDIPGAMIMTQIVNLRGVSNMHEQVAALKAKFKSYWMPMTVPLVREENIFNAVKWLDRVGAAGGSVSNSVQLVFELLCTRDSSSGASGSAWPRPPGMKNTIICAAGCDAKEGTEQEEATARTLCMDALDVIIGTGEQRQGVGIAANAVEKFHDLESVFGKHLPKLLKLKKRYDPRNKLKGPISLSA